MPTNNYPDIITQPLRSYTTNYHPNSAQIFIRMGSLARLRELSARGAVSLTPQFDINTGFFYFDLLITRVVDRAIEFNKVTPYIGNVFSHTFLGKSPVGVQVEGILVESARNEAKYAFMRAYSELFRISRVARFQIAPTIAFNDAYLTGAFTSLNVSETSADENQIPISFEFLVLEAFYRSHEQLGAVSTLSVDYSNMSKFVDTTFRPGN